MKTKDQFWLVWNENGSTPKYRHTIRANAEKEAERIARLAPGSEVFVVQAVASFKLTDIERTEYADVPF